jgi:hypothetical protein
MLDFYHEDDLLAGIDERKHEEHQGERQTVLVRILTAQGLDFYPERLARAMIAYQDNTDPDNEAERLAISANSIGDGPGLWIGGIEITSGEIEVIERLEGINRERGYQ